MMLVMRHSRQAFWIDVSDGLDLLYELESRIGNMNPGDLYEPIELIITNTGTKSYMVR